jgi:hypothetical protein
MTRNNGNVNVNYKYLILYYNKKLEIWQELGIYTSLKKASEKLNINYYILTDLYKNNGKRKIYDKFYKIEKVNKYGETKNEENLFN